MKNNYIGENLKRIRLLKQLSLKEAGLLMNLSAPGLAKYEKGEVIPDSKRLIEFANAYDVKAADILKIHSEIKMNFNSFRKRKKLDGQKLELLKDIIQDEVGNYFDILEESNITEYNNKFIKYSCNNYIDAEKAADSFRRHYNLSINQPISNLIDILENIGILIIEIENKNNMFDGFDGLSEIINNRPVIIIKNISDGARQRFTIAHELGHLLLEIKDSNIDEEKLCNAFASSLLMPKEAVINEFGSIRKNLSFYELISFKKEYKVSIAAIIYRLKELNIISEYTYKNLNIFMSKNNYKKEEPVNIPPECSDQYKRIVHRLYADSIISINRASELLGMSIDEYNIEDNYYRH